MFGGILDKILNEGKAIQVMRETFIVLFLVISVPSFSQVIVGEPQYTTVNMDYVRYGKYKTKKEGINTGFKLKAANPDLKVVVQMYDRIDLVITNFSLIDTIEVSRRIDVDGKPVKAFRDLVIDGSIYMLFKVEGMVEFNPDTSYSWQIDYRFKRIKEFGKISYKNLTTPFQYMEIYFLKKDSTSTMLYARITEKQVRITSWLDGVKYKEFTPGTSITYEIGFEYQFTIGGLTEGKDYAFKLETENEDGEIITYQTVLRI